MQLASNCKPFQWLLKVLVLWSLVDNSKAGNELPSLLSFLGPEQSYHLSFQLQMLGSGQRLMIEEWASFDKQLLRLDLTTSEHRVTYQINGKTGEIFNYYPFTCALLQPDDDKLKILKKFFKGFKFSDDGSPEFYGLGPLWLRAQAMATSEKISSADLEKDRTKSFMQRYMGYRVRFDSNDEEVPFVLRLYFPCVGGQKFVDAIEWLDGDEQKAPEARAKLMTLDLEPVEESIFDLPIGYGCSRSARFDHPLKQQTEFKLLHEGEPSQATIEVTTSRPKGKQLSTWESHKYTIRLLRGAMKLNGLIHTYFVTLTQARDSESSKLKRSKRVWSAHEDSDQATVYTIDTGTGKCLVNHEEFKNSIKLVFPTKQMYEPAPMTLDTDLITSLFSDQNDYHMIRDNNIMSANNGASGESSANESRAGGANSSVNNLFREIVYEKRDSNFKLDKSGTDGNPVSIVKRVRSFAPLLKSSPKAENGMATDQSSILNFDTTITLFFYNSDYSEIIYKATIDLLDAEEVDVNFMHKQLDIGSCFREEQRKTVVIKYPIESRELTKKLETIQDLVREVFCITLFETTSIEPIQVTDVELSFDAFFLYIKMTLLDLPLNQIYELRPKKRLVRADDPSAFIEKLTPNVEKCAASCDHLRCFRFSYDSSQLRCRLELKKNGARSEASEFDELYEPRATPGAHLSLWAKLIGQSSTLGTHLRPQAIVSLLREFLAIEEKNAELDADPSPDDTSKRRVDTPLSIRLLYYLLPGYKWAIEDKDWFELRPSSIESDLDWVNELDLEQSERKASETRMDSEDDPSNFRMEYSVLVDGREFQASQTGLIQGVTSYEECAQTCEDNDCRSFSYCEHKQTCHFTQFHLVEDIMRATSADLRCTVFGLDFLSKFEDFGLVLAPYTPSRRTLSDLSLHDCARTCMEEQTFTCQGFYHCEEATSNRISSRCRLEDKHIADIKPADFGTPRVISVGPQENKQVGEVVEGEGKRCSFYARSYLSQFDAYYDKTLQFGEEKAQDQSESSGASTLMVDIITGQGADKCAEMCIHGACLAFDVCLKPHEGFKLDGRVCQLVRHGIKKSHLVSRQRCTTFVLSDKSQFKKLKQLQDETIADGNNKPDRVANLENDDGSSSSSSSSSTSSDTDDVDLSANDDLTASLLSVISSLHPKTLIDNSHWLAKLLSATFGILIGLTCAYLWARRDDIYNIVSSRLASSQR